MDGVPHESSHHHEGVPDPIFNLAQSRESCHNYNAHHRFRDCTSHFLFKKCNIFSVGVCLLMVLQLAAGPVCVEML